jgi:L-serine kinase (ADP)
VTAPVEFALLPIGKLKAHEKVDPAKVHLLAVELTRQGVFVEPVIVARGDHVILNGHHRVAALLELGAARVPVWLVDYTSDAIALDRWTPGPPISKEDVVRRASEGRLFPVRTTRHRWKIDPGRHPTPLSELGVANGGTRRPGPKGA